MTDDNKRAPETDVAQGLHYIDPQTGSIVPPVQPSTTFARDEHYELVSAAHSYGRDENPSFAMAEDLLTRLEGGAAARLFSSGMAAGAAVVQALKPGDHVVIPKVMYWGLRNWMVRYCERWEFISISSMPPIPMIWRTRSSRAALRWSGSKRPATRPGTLSTSSWLPR